jgi:hypothetical protein
MLTSKKIKGSKCMIIKKDQKTGKYFFRVDVGNDPSTGKRKQKYHSFPTKKAAQEALANIQVQINEGSYLEPSMEDFHVYMNRWFETVYRRSVEITTAESRRHFLDRHILRYFQHQKLSDIDTFAIDEFYEFCSEEGLSPVTIKIVHSLLNQAFKKAVKWKLIKVNPVLDSSPPPVRNSKVKDLWT